MHGIDLEQIGTPARLAVGIVSAGRVGIALGVALERVGHVVAAATARAEATRDRLAQRLPETQVLDPVAVAQRAELLVLAVPDTALSDVIEQLDRAEAVGPGHIVVHTAGAFGAAVLRPFQARGAVVVAAHPAMTFTGTETDVDRLSGCGWAVTAPDEIGEAVGQSLVLELGGRPVTIDEDRRGLYHAALAHGSNHLVTLIADAVDVLRHSIGSMTTVAGTDPDGLAAQLLGPLVQAALDNALDRGDAALTGPVMRGDVTTVRRHLEQLAGCDPEIAEGYRALARRTAQRVARRGKPNQQLRELLDDNR